MVSGRLFGGDAARTPAVLGALLELGVLTTSRWVKGLGEVATRSAAHRAATRRLIVSLLENGQAAHLGRDLGPALALLVELCAEDKVTVDDPAARSFLAGVAAGGNAGRAARRLLQ
jgi:hypothetical protein